MAAYSFVDTVATIAGPGGVISLGAGSGAAEEGITIDQAEDKDRMTVGADGTVMHSLHADKSGTFTVRLLKTSPVNAQLQAMYDIQTTSSALWGINVIALSQLSMGDNVTGRAAAFRKQSPLTYAKDATMNEWAFNVGLIDRILGAG